ncbi:quinate/shikimate dehydrogenase, partial [Klebsiella pneumoniae]
GHTEQKGQIPTPKRHSKTPTKHNEANANHGQDNDKHAKEDGNQEQKDVELGYLAMKLRGNNDTKPYKTEICQ